jgi:hypothetical protein
MKNCEKCSIIVRMRTKRGSWVDGRGKNEVGKAIRANTKN